MRFQPVPMRQGETLGAYHQIDSDEHARRRDTQFAEAQVAPFPVSWARKLLDRWGSRRGDERAGANIELLRRSKLLRQSQAAGLQADANDNDLIARARDAARDFARRLCHVEVIAQGASSFSHVGAKAMRLLKLLHVGAWLDEQHLGDQWQRLRKAHEGRACLLRVVCEKWWRRVLRALHARTVEACAIDLRLVHKRGDCYVSSEGVRARRGQVQRNAALLDRTKAVNDEGQAYTLAELAATGPANAEIRRAELMTRIAGFELIARECGHVADFVTVTCPSRMHSMRTAGRWRTEPNPGYDGTKPCDAQMHLSAQWAKCRAWLHRHKVGVYGFRITEPNHDGTPHWHLLVFYPPEHAGPVRWALRVYFLNAVDGGERGAAKHRVTVERIDPARGSAAGYVAKYVAKNIDGYKVEKDLYGNDAIVASERVQAWAARWRIRQFQQIGGAPVTIWRELRRLNPQVLDGEEASVLHDALRACNTSQRAKEALTDGVQRHTAALGWQQYVMMQGGPTARRGERSIVLHKDQRGELGRYGEPMPPRSIGVVAMGYAPVWVPMALNRNGGFMGRRRAVTVAQSERNQWIVVPGVSLEEARRIAMARGEAARPWTRVNNCTVGHGLGIYEAHPETPFAAVSQVRPKLGRVQRATNGGVHNRKENDDPPGNTRKRG